MKTNKFNKVLVLKSSTENLATIRDFVRDTAEAIGFSQDAIGKIILSVDEACTNVIKHAYQYSPDGDITIKTDFVQNKKYVISIEDDGTPFNPDSVPEPDLKEYIKQRRVGGLGMFLMKKLMDEVQYNKLEKNKNQVVLIKYLS